MDHKEESLHARWSVAVRAQQQQEKRIEAALIKGGLTTAAAGELVGRLVTKCHDTAEKGTTWEAYATANEAPR